MEGKRRDTSDKPGTKKRKETRVEASEKKNLIEANGEAGSLDGILDAKDAEEVILQDESKNMQEDDVIPAMNLLKDDDPFVQHFERIISDTLVEQLQSPSAKYTESVAKYPFIGNVIRKRLDQIPDPNSSPFSWDKSHVRQSLLKNVLADSTGWSEKSTELFSFMNTYEDMYVLNQKSDDETKRAYCLHILNHVLKTRQRVITHNEKLSKKDMDDDMKFRDQGFTRPKVLILLPFRNQAFRVYQIMSELLAKENEIQIMNRKRFEDEFGWTDADPLANADRPEDFRQMFAGNIDDCFRIGISISKKTMKLYTEFYSADIILASPLGLRMIIGSEGEKQHEYDFLSSIEILIMDQTDVFMMQNWEHVSHIIKHLHRQPKATHDTDFNRVRLWTLNGWGQCYRQTLLFSAFRCPEIQAVINKNCRNFAGSIMTKFEVPNPAISSVVISTTHTFHKVGGNDLASANEMRFKLFVEKILPSFTAAEKGSTMIFVPSYFDFVKLRNYYKKEDLSFVQICEYSETNKVARARDLFFHGKKRFMLFTERFHFFRRYYIRGVRHLIFFQLPLYAHFYWELCNGMVAGENSLDQLTVEVLFSKFDTFSLASVLGVDNASKLVLSDKSNHVFVTSPAKE